MVLNDSELRALCNGSTKLIQPYEEEKLINCSYSLTVGEVLEPNSGESFSFCNTGTNIPSRTRILRPTECIVVITAETVKLPTNLMASYTPHNRNAKDGLMLINASIVEPGYEGPLSCVLVNLSATPISISAGLEIVKVVFHQLSAESTKQEPYSIEHQKYVTDMRKVAIKYQTSFMDIKEVISKAKDAAISGANKAILFGSIIIAMLLLFAQLEPIFTHWIWAKTGVTTATRSMEQIKQQFELEKQSQKLEDESKITLLQKDISELRLQIADMKKKSTGGK